MTVSIIHEQWNDEDGYEIFKSSVMFYTRLCDSPARAQWDSLDNHMRRVRIVIAG